jgi:extradiol dioxygenase family protein
MTVTRPFHLAFPVSDIESTRHFYIDVLECEQGREAPTWIDFSLFGHQLSAHVLPSNQRVEASAGAVDADTVPVPHFGVVLTMEQWSALAARLEARPDEIDWVLRPKVRFKGEPGEQATFFVRDPSGNALEFKGFRSDQGLFAT